MLFGRLTKFYVVTVLKPKQIINFFSENIYNVVFFYRTLQKHFLIQFSIFLFIFKTTLFNPWKYIEL